jgi:hypothetical protein
LPIIAHHGPVGLRATSANLSASVGAPEPHDFSVRNCIARPARRDRSRVAPPCDPPCARDTLASIAFRPNVRDDAYVPLSGRDGNRKPLIWGKPEANYFCVGDWTTQIRLKRFRKLVFRRTRFSGPSSVHKQTIQTDSPDRQVTHGRHLQPRYCNTSDGLVKTTREQEGAS